MNDARRTLPSGPVLVTGAGGQLGTEVTRWLASHGVEVVGADHGALDITDPTEVDRVTEEVAPAVVIHCAAYTAVDDCESHPERAHLVNETGTRLVAQAAAAQGAFLVAVSTDYVFDGTKAGPYVEDDPPNPKSVYGASKLAGERAALGSGAEVAVVRTSWVCGAHGPNIVRTVLRLAADPDRTMAFVDDQHGCPTFTADLAPVLAAIAGTRMTGVVHAANQGPTTWYGFVREVLRVAGHDPDRVSPIATSELDPPRPAPRPANSVLATLRLDAAGLSLPLWRDSLPTLVRELQEAGW